MTKSSQTKRPFYLLVDTLNLHAMMYISREKLKISVHICSISVI